ncbi:response regulator, partial [Vibrio sp. M260118]|uniref:response regulator n=1 Tax=Vibrio sp. M260118 TaxID=3020896 RepID=UPI002F42AC6D
MTSATRVMIIEDDLAIAQLHQRYLEQIGGYEVIGIATTQLEANLQLEILNPDLLLLDVHLPDGTGLDILQSLRINKMGCDVILITAARDVDTLQ